MDDFQSFIGMVSLVILVLIFGSSRLRSRKDTSEARRIADLKSRAGKPDMALSAGRDAAAKLANVKEVFVPMHPEEEEAMRAFYLGILGMAEMRSPNYPRDQDGFWAIMGARRVYFGLSPSFPVDRKVPPILTTRDLDAMADILTVAGHEIAWDNRDSYARRLATVDPAGNGILFLRG